MTYTNMRGMSRAPRVFLSPDQRILRNVYPVDVIDTSMQPDLSHGGKWDFSRKGIAKYLKIKCEIV